MNIALGMLLWILSGLLFWSLFVLLGLRFRPVDEPEAEPEATASPIRAPEPRRPHVPSGAVRRRARSSGTSRAKR